MCNQDNISCNDYNEWPMKSALIASEMELKHAVCYLNLGLAFSDKDDGCHKMFWGLCNTCFVH